MCRINGISSPAILAAFATVPRERFVGPGPWIIQSSGTSWFTEDADPTHVYRDALIVLDEAKHLNNGQPSLWASALDLLNVHPGDHILHLGCGTGYYTAILAELTGPHGKIIAIEIDEGLAARAAVALVPWPQVTVVHADGASGPFEPADVIVVSAGATHPLPAWLAALKPEGKLLFPLTSTRGPGTMALHHSQERRSLRSHTRRLRLLRRFCRSARPRRQQRARQRAQARSGRRRAVAALRSRTKKTNPAGCTATAGASRGSD